MKTVLIIAYHFPPSYSGGIYRPLKFAKYLPEYGWKPVILTVKNYAKIVLDESLLGELPCDTPMYYAYSLELEKFENWFFNKLYRKPRQITSKANVEKPPGKEQKKPNPSLLKRCLFSPLNNFLRNVIYTPDSKIGWFPLALYQGLRAIKREKIDIIFSTSPPETSHLVGLWLNKLTNKPLVVDFRDPWTTHYIRQNVPELALTSPYVSPTRFKYERWLERRVLKNADSIIHTGFRRAELVKEAFADIPFDKHHIITNGYDEADFAGSTPDEIYSQDGTSCLNIVSIGHLYEDSALYNFLEGVKRAIQTSNSSNKIKVSFISGSHSIIRSALSKLALEKDIELIDFNTHKEAIMRLMKADVLLLMPPSGGGLHKDIIVAGKTFELIRSGRPILMIGWEGESSQIIEQSGIGKFIPLQNIDQIEKSILDYYHKKINGDLIAKPNWEYISQFERKHLTGKLAELLDSAYKD